MSGQYSGLELGPIPEHPTIKEAAAALQALHSAAYSGLREPFCRRYRDIIYRYMFGDKKVSEIANIPDSKDEVLVLSRGEASEIIAFLASQLADVPVKNNHAGACPTI